jgi:hypothetical protein
MDDFEISDGKLKTKNINLFSISIPPSVITLDKECFRNCSLLQSLDIPNSITAFDNSSFENYASFASIFFTSLIFA